MKTNESYNHKLEEQLTTANNLASPLNQPYLDPNGYDVRRMLVERMGFKPSSLGGLVLEGNNMSISYAGPRGFRLSLKDRNEGTLAETNNVLTTLVASLESLSPYSPKPDAPARI